MTIEKLEEFASNGDKHLTGLDVATGFPRADKPERPWFNKLFGDITGKINEVVDSIDELPPFEGGVLADTFVVVDGSLSQRTVNKGLESIADLSTINNPKNGLRVYVKSYHAGLNKGGGFFIWLSDVNKSTHNGGTIIDPDKIPELSTTNPSWYTPNDSGKGVFVRVGVTSRLHASWFGAKSDGVTSDSLPINTAISVRPNLLLDEEGTYLLTDPIVVTNAGNGFYLGGISRAKTILLKKTLNTPNIVRSYGDEDYEYNKPCVLALVADNDNYARHVVIESLQMFGDDGFKNDMIHAPRLSYAIFSDIEAFKTSSFFNSTESSFVVTFREVRSSLNEDGGWIVANGNAYNLYGCYSNSGSGNPSGISTGYIFRDSNVTLHGCDTDGTNTGFSAVGTTSMTLNGCFTESRLELVSARDDSIVTVIGGRYLMGIIGSQANSQQAVFIAIGGGKINVYGSTIDFKNYTTTPDEELVNKYIARTYLNNKPSVTLNDINIIADYLKDYPVRVEQSNGTINFTRAGKSFKKTTGKLSALSTSMSDASMIKRFQVTPVFSGAGKHLICVINTLSTNQMMFADLEVDIFAVIDGAGVSYTTFCVGRASLLASRIATTTQISFKDYSASLGHAAGADEILLTAENVNGVVSLYATTKRAFTTVVGSITQQYRVVDANSDYI